MKSSTWRGGGTQATSDFSNDNVTVIAKDYSILDSLHKVA